MSLLAFCAKAQEAPKGAETGESSDSLITLLPSFNEKQPRFLSLEKKGKVKRLRFFVGDQIEFLIKDDPNLYRPVIEGIQDSAIVVYETVIPLSQIKAIYIQPERPFASLLSRALTTVGVGYLALDLANHSFTLRRGTLITTGSLLAGGFLLKQLTKKRKIKLNKNRYLKIMRAF